MFLLVIPGGPLPLAAISRVFIVASVIVFVVVIFIPVRQLDWSGTLAVIGLWPLSVRFGASNVEYLDVASQQWRRKWSLRAGRWGQLGGGPSPSSARLVAQAQRRLELAGKLVKGGLSFQFGPVGAAKQERRRCGRRGPRRLLLAIVDDGDVGLVLGAGKVQRLVLLWLVVFDAAAKRQELVEKSARTRFG